MSPLKEPSLHIFLMESRRERCPILRAVLHSSFKIPVIQASLLIPGSPQTYMGPYGERCPYPEPFLTYLPGSPVKKLSTLSPFGEKHSIPRASLVHLSKALVDEPPFRFPSGAPTERDARLQSLFYISFMVPSKGALPPGSLHRAPTERDTPAPEPLSTISQSPR